MPPHTLPQVGDRIASWVVLAELGRGGMGAVYRARHVETGAIHALKVILPHAQVDATDLARFEREAALLAEVDHPSVVRVHALGRERGVVCCAMELIEGSSLQNQLGREGALEQTVAARLIIDLAPGLDHVHGLGIVHRDLKPDNILVDGAGRPRLIDFGLARSTASAQLTATGEVLGTPCFMAPEQVIGGAISPATDVYGLGATLYGLLTGRPPFAGSGLQATLTRVATDDPTPPSHYAEGLPLELEAVVAKAMRKDPAERYASAGELAVDLERWLRGERIAAPPVRRRRFAIALLAGTALLAALLAALGLLAGRSTSPLAESDLIRLERRLARDGRLEAGALGPGLAPDASDDLRERFELLQLIEATLGDLGPGGEATARAGWRRMADLIRDDAGELHVARARLVAAVLANARRWRALHHVLHGHAAQAPVPPEMADGLAAHLLEVGFDGVIPDEDAVTALIRPLGTRRNGFLVHWSLAAAEAGQLDAAIERLVEAQQTPDAVVPAPEDVDRRLARRLAERIAATWVAPGADPIDRGELMDLWLHIDPAAELPPLDMLPGLVDRLLQLPQNLGDRDVDLDGELSLLTFLAATGSSPLHSRGELRGPLRAVAVRLVERVRDELARPATRRCLARAVVETWLVSSVARQYAEHADAADELIALLERASGASGASAGSNRLVALLLADAHTDRWSFGPAVAAIDRALGPERDRPAVTRWPSVPLEAAKTRIEWLRIKANEESWIAREPLIQQAFALLNEAERVHEAHAETRAAILERGQLVSSTFSRLGLHRELVGLAEQIIEWRGAPGCCRGTLSAKALLARARRLEGLPDLGDEGGWLVQLREAAEARHAERHGPR